MLDGGALCMELMTPQVQTFSYLYSTFDDMNLSIILSYLELNVEVPNPRAGAQLTLLKQ